MTSRELADAIKERDEARAALAEEKEKREKAETESQDLQKNIDALEEALKEAQESEGGEPDEETKKRIEIIEREKAALEAKLKKAEKERDEAAKQRQEIANAKVEQESELMNELDALRAQVERLVKESVKEQNADPGKAAFSAYFNLSKNAFNGMLEAVGKIEDDQEKYRAAMVKMLEAMIETAKEG